MQIQHRRALLRPRSPSFAHPLRIRCVKRMRAIEILSPQQRREQLARCLRTAPVCGETTWSGLVDSSPDEKEQASLEALVAGRLAARELLQIVQERSGARSRVPSVECSQGSVDARERARVALRRVDDADARIRRGATGRDVLAVIPGRGWLREAELLVRWCADCSPEHAAQCNEATESLARAQAAMDAAGW